MSFKALILALLVGTSLLLQGCISFNSLADARDGKGSGQVKEYSANRDQVWQQALAIIEESDLNLVNADATQGLILAQQPIAPLSLTAGQNVAIYVSESHGRTRVEVISRKALGDIEFVSKDWEDYILERLDQRFI